MTSLQDAISNLYSTFNKYTTKDIHYCTCGCIHPDDVKKLHSKALHELGEDDLVSYHGSALYTWGDVSHYKHFLPRICELSSLKRNFAFISLDEIKVKLEYAKWEEWPYEERQAILNYVIADWIDQVNRNRSEIKDSEIATYSYFFELEEVLKHWEVHLSANAVRNFVYFFYHYGAQILHGGLRIGAKKYAAEFLNWLQREKLVSILELSFFENEQKDPEYASQISIVLQMIEQHLRFNTH